MRLAGRSAPRRKVADGGLAVRAAQSRGLWPGGRITFREEREAGGRVDVDAATEGARELKGLGSARRVDAREGGGAREEELSFGSGRRAEGRSDGGGIRREADWVGLEVGCGDRAVMDEARRRSSLGAVVGICFGVVDGFCSAVLVVCCRAGRPVLLVVPLDALSSTNVGVERCAPGLRDPVVGLVSGDRFTVRISPFRTISLGALRDLKSPSIFSVFLKSSLPSPSPSPLPAENLSALP